MLTKKELTPEEVVGVAMDVIRAGIDTVSDISIEVSFLCDYNMYQARKGVQCLRMFSPIATAHFYCARYSN